MPVLKNPPGPHAELGARIRDARKAANLSQERLSRAVPMDRVYLIKLEGGHHRPSPEMLHRIAATLECDPDELAGDDGEDPG